MIRRRFLSLWASVFVLPWWGRRSFAAGRSASPRDQLCDWAVCRCERGHARIGQKATALGLVPTEADSLLAGLEDRMQAAAKPSPVEPQMFERLLAQAVSDDFGNDRIIEVDGWILSATEVELCALAAVAKTQRLQNGRFRPKVFK
jgi:hypothetical protein